jgi:ubiquitin thioesterase OTU1
MSPFEEAPEEFDQTIFVVKDQSIGAVEGLTLNLVKEQQRYITTLEIINITNFLYKVHI